VARAINLRRDRYLFFSGLILLLLGGPGLLVGSFGHDAFRVPVVGQAYDAFGWMNQTVLGLGIVLLVIGVLFTALALKGGVLSEAEAAELEAGRSRS